jgi:formaldehyde-activating enzyme involved in methanogenesis
MLSRVKSAKAEKAEEERLAKEIITTEQAQGMVVNAETAIAGILRNAKRLQQKNMTAEYNNLKSACATIGNFDKAVEAYEIKKRGRQAK